MTATTTDPALPGPTAPAGPTVDAIVAREQPNDHRAEQALLGAVLAGYPVEDINLAPEDFYDIWHAEVWAAAQTLTAQGKRPDITLVAARMPDKALDLFDLLTGAGIPANVPVYAATIADHSGRRWMLNLLAGAWQHATTLDADTMADKLRSMLDAREASHTDAARIADAIPAMLDRIEAGAMRGDSTPWPELDRWLTLQGGRLYTVAARPGVGKSLFGQAIASHMSRVHGKASFVASLEMPTDEYVQRFLAAESGIPLGTMDQGMLTADQWNQMSAATAKLNGWDVYVNDSTRQNLATIRSDARMVARRHTLGAIIVDYLQLVQPADRRVNREQQVAALTAGFKALAKDLNVPVILIAQLNRENVRDKRQPRVSDLRESGAIEQDSDAVLLLHEPDAVDGQENNNLRLLIEKNRGGRNHGRVNLIRKGWVSRLEEAPPEWRSAS